MMVLSLSLLILGFGCVSWAVYNIGTSYEGPMVAENSTASSLRLRTLPDVMEAASHSAKTDPAQLGPVQSPPPKPRVYKEGEVMGSLEIPLLKREVTLVQGTSAKSLKKGAGHFTQSVFPGAADNCVISGHRDTVFTKIGQLKIGDDLIVKTADGTFTYEVTGTRIVHKDDRTVIVPTNHAVLTLTTCYPFRFIGNAPDRYIISADLIKTVLAE